MQLSRLQVNKLPGLPDRFELEARPGVNLIVGPNGSGKSSLTRAVFHLLWPKLLDIQSCDVIADFRFQDQIWQAAHQDGLPLQWTRDGQPVPAPALPDPHVARSYKLGMLDLNLAEIGTDDQELARQIATRMDGGFDLARTEENLFKIPAQAGRTEQKNLNAAARQAQEIKTRHRHLAVRQKSLLELEKELESARLADDRRRQLGRIMELRQRQIDLAAAETRLADFPAGVAKIREGDPQDLAEFRKLEQQHLASQVTQETALEQLRMRQNTLRPPGPAGKTLAPDLLARLIKEYERLGQLRDQAARNLAAAQSSLKASAGPDGAGGSRAVDRQTYNRLTDLHAELIECSATGQAWETQLHALEKRLSAQTPWTWILLSAGLLAAVAAIWVLRGAGAVDWLPTLLIILGAAGLLTGTFLLGLGRNHAAELQIEDLKTMLAKVEQTRFRAETQLAELAAEHGLDLDNPHLLHDLKNLALHQEAQAAAARTEGELAGHEAEVAGALALINQHLTEAGLTSVTGVTEAEQRLEDLREDSRREEKLQGEIEKTEQALAHTRLNLEGTRNSVHGLFARLHLHQDEGDQAVSELLAAQPGFQETEKTAAACRLDIIRLETEITGSGHLLDPASVQDQSFEQLERTAALEDELAAREAPLVDEIAEIKNLVKTTSAEHRLASAMALEDGCREDLSLKRDDVRQAALGRLLLGQVRQQNESRSRPPVLKKAQELFLLFTTGKFELLVAAGGPDGLTSFRARNLDSGLSLDLSQLSDGTRAQLLLAVRLGFIFTAEGDVHPPLFLDDSLTASDPHRFATVAASLGQAARDHDRQIIYLTASPADAAAWQKALQDAQLPAAHLIDLGLKRKLWSAADVDQLVPADLDGVPSPLGKSPEDYARELLVPRLDGWAAPSAAHLFYFLSDHLDILHQLLLAGAPTLGRWQKHRGPLLESGTLQDDQDQLLAVRSDIWSALLEAWRVGRGRPVAMSDLQASGVVTATMGQKVAEVLRECGHDGAQLMDALAAGKVPRFQEGKKKLLQEYLEQHGFLDQRQTLDPEELILQVRAGVAGHLRSGAIAGAEFRSLVQSMTHYLNQSA